MSSLKKGTYSFLLPALVSSIGQDSWYLTIVRAKFVERQPPPFLYCVLQFVLFGSHLFERKKYKSYKIKSMLELKCFLISYQLLMDFLPRPSLGWVPLHFKYWVDRGQLKEKTTWNFAVQEVLAWVTQLRFKQGGWPRGSTLMDQSYIFMISCRDIVPFLKTEWNHLYWALFSWKKWGPKAVFT